MDNILFIFTDQWQGGATGYNAHPIEKTPNLDRLAKKSVNYVNSFTVCPLCTPARGAIMTGLYPHQSGVIDNCDVGASRQEYLPNSAYTWLDAMRDSGRKTGYFGKWHLGLDWQTPDKHVDFDICRIESDRIVHETRIPQLLSAASWMDILTWERLSFRRICMRHSTESLVLWQIDLNTR